MAQITLSNIKEIVGADAKVDGAKADNSLVTGISVAMEAKDGFIPGDLVISTIEAPEKEKLQRGNGQELWNYSTWSYKYRECKNFNTLSTKAQEFITKMIELVSQYDDATLSEHAIFKRKK